MTAQVIFAVNKILDQAALVEYRKLAHPTIKAFNGRVLSGFDGYVALEGDHFIAMVVVEFSDRSVAECWFKSEEYQQASLLRKKGCECSVSLLNCA